MSYQHKISADGPFHPAKGRYLLYAAYPCPYASRALAMIGIKGLQDVIEVAVASPVSALTKPGMDEHKGWVFDPSYDSSCTVDPVFGAKSVREVYEICAGREGGVKVERFSVPVLLDKETKRIVNTESAEIAEIFNSAFNDFAQFPKINIFPKHLQSKIQDMEGVVKGINAGPYACGFAQTQKVYDDAISSFYGRVDSLEKILAESRFVLGDYITVVDIFIFMTLIRLDQSYYVLLKCSQKMIRECPNLEMWMRDVFNSARLAPFVNLAHNRHSYACAFNEFNPHRIIPATSPLNLEPATSRRSLSKSETDFFESA